MDSLVFAHAGHWLIDLIYLLPLLALAVAFVVGKWRDRKSGSPRQS